MQDGGGGLRYHRRRIERTVNVTDDATADYTSAKLSDDSEV